MTSTKGSWPKARTRHLRPLFFALALGMIGLAVYDALPEGRVEGIYCGKVTGFGFVTHGRTKGLSAPPVTTLEVALDCGGETTVTTNNEGLLLNETVMLIRTSNKFGFDVGFSLQADQEFPSIPIDVPRYCDCDQQ